MYLMVCGFHPFASDNVAETMQLISEANLEFPSPYWDAISDKAKDLLTHMLQKDPTKRYSAEQCLAHPWISGLDEVPETNLADALSMIRRINAKKKLRKVVRGIIMVRRLSQIMRGGKPRAPAAEGEAAESAAAAGVGETANGGGGAAGEDAAEADVKSDHTASPQGRSPVAPVSTLEAGAEEGERLLVERTLSPLVDDVGSQTLGKMRAAQRINFASGDGSLAAKIQVHRVRRQTSAQLSQPARASTPDGKIRGSVRRATSLGLTRYVDAACNQTGATQHLVKAQARVCMSTCR